MVEQKPYIDLSKRENFTVRKFSQDIDPIELLWHRDLKTRDVTVIEGEDWKIQLENELPKPFNTIRIPKLTWHRVIKGRGDLIIQIKEIE